MFQPVSVLFLNNSLSVPVPVIYNDQFLCVLPVSLVTKALFPLLFNILNQNNPCVMKSEVPHGIDKYQHSFVIKIISIN